MTSKGIQAKDIPQEVFEMGIEAVIKYCADNEIDIMIPVSKGL